jgi:hypothetical protein
MESRLAIRQKSSLLNSKDKFVKSGCPPTESVARLASGCAVYAAVRPRQRHWRPAAHQSPEESPARSGAYAASLRDMNSVKSRTRFVLRVSPCVRSQSVPYMCRSAPGALASTGSASPTKHGRVVIPSPCRTAAICASASVILKGTPVAPTSPSLAQSGIPCMPMTIYRMGSSAPARHAASRSRDM